MPFYVDTLRDRAPGVLAAMGVEPSIGLSLRDADLATIAVVVHCLIVRGIHTKTRILRYLNEHSSPFQRAEIAEVMRTFEGPDPDLHLWFRLPNGSFDPVFKDDLDVTY